ncbi:MAG: phosphomethylpyrimidine synthase ThiC, partial [Thermodesulfobacteriota bacterium]
REGVIASKIAASAVDLARHHPREIERNLAMSEARQRFDWEGQQNLAIDPAKFCDYLEKVDPEAEGDPNQACSMCGEWCALKRANSR